jgi:hypothetical protein
MNGPLGDGQTKRQKNKFQLLPQRSQGETFNQYHMILKTIIRWCLDMRWNSWNNVQTLKNHF